MPIQHPRPEPYQLPRQGAANDNGPVSGYCATCGAGYIEFMGCDNPDCSWVVTARPPLPRE